jgi:GNAT superfamily N-acetyltransferase
MLFCDGGVAGLVALATLPAHRRKGIGSALQLARIRDAQALGYRYAALFASQMGYSAYQKLGFRDTGVRVSRYLWRVDS